MKIFRIKDRLPERLADVVLTMGNFDGVHKGHQRLLQLTLEKARQRGGTAAALTFEPHPVQLFKPTDFQLIQPTEEKLERIARCGLDAAVVMEFTRDLADRGPEEFVADYLLGLFDLKETVVGYDTTFGKGRSGDPQLLTALGNRHGFANTVVEPVMVGNRPVSSSRIRKAVMVGDIADANDCLGYAFRLAGTVIKGYGRGAAILGYPTANLQIGRRLLPGPGVYACWVERRRERFRGAMSVGTNPTFGNSRLSVEVYILDFDENIYGETIVVKLAARLRDNIRFDRIEDLKARMTRDVEEVRRVLV